jgi:hypothetical protein
VTRGRARVGEAKWSRDGSVLRTWLWILPRPLDAGLYDPPLECMAGHPRQSRRGDDAATSVEGGNTELPLGGGQVVGVEDDWWVMFVGMFISSDG